MSEPPPTVELELHDETAAAAGHLPLLRRIVERTIATEGLVGSYQLSITIVRDEQIRELNRVHRGKDAITDVLSFPLVDQDSAEFVLPAGVPTHLGDVVIALGQTQRQAEEYGHSFERELAYLAVHGVLHLLGYDHEEDEDRIQMRTREEEILADLPR